MTTPPHDAETAPDAQAAPDAQTAPDIQAQHEARAALDQAAASSANLRAAAAWMPRYLAGFGIGFGLITANIGLVDPPVLRWTVFTIAWAGFVFGMTRWAATRRAGVAGSTRRSVPWWVATVVLYAAALVVGLDRFAGQPAFWVPASVVVALPLLIAAARERTA